MSDVQVDLPRASAAAAKDAGDEVLKFKDEIDAAPVQ